MEEEVDDPQPQPVGNLPLPPTAAHKTTLEVGKRRERDTVPNEVGGIVDVLKSSMQSREERESRMENDSDRMFLLSLLEPLKGIPLDLDLDFRLRWKLCR